MKSLSITGWIFMLGTVLLSTSAPAVETPTLKLVDMYAKAEGDDFKIHIHANGDISEYKTTRQVDTETYKLILDVPALPPLDSKYDLATPFSTRFEVWPMMLGQQTYSRISLDLDIDTSSVVGQENPTTVTITLSRLPTEDAEHLLDATPVEAEPGEPMETASDSEHESPPPPSPTSSTSETLPPLYEGSEDVETGRGTRVEDSAASEPTVSEVAPSESALSR